MKIAGQEVQGISEEILVLPRLDGDLVFRAQAVQDYDAFEALCPEPKAKRMLVAGGWKEDTKSPGYKKEMEEFAERRFAYIALKSLEPSEIEWDTVNMDDPSTWANYMEDLKKAGLSATEVNRIVLCVMSANCLDEGKLEKARDAFLRGLEEEKTEKSSGPQDEQPST